MTLEAFKESSDIYKRNFKKIVKLLVDDIWKEKNRKALAQYSGSAKDRKGCVGSYYYDSYDGRKYVEEEKKRLGKIVKGKTRDSIVAHRSPMYNSWAKTTDLSKIEEPLPWTKAKVDYSQKSNVYKKRLDPASQNFKRDLKWQSTMTESGIKLSTITPGPGAYAQTSTAIQKIKKGYSFGQYQNNEVKIKLGFDPASQL